MDNSMEDWKIWAELGRRMGYSEFFPWEETEDLFSFLLEGTGITTDRLKTRPGGVAYRSATYRKYLEHGFNTPSGKVEIFSELMKAYGYDPIPTFREPAESVISRPDLAETYPLTLVTGPRIKSYYHSQYRNLPGLRRTAPEPLMEIHPVTAETYGVRDGQRIRVESLRGEIVIRARVTEDILPGVLSIQHGWEEANANILSDDENRDPTSAYPGFRSVLCRLKGTER
jgi:anaerobic selenocysteine-containing dehydrogenase